MKNTMKIAEQVYNELLGDLVSFDIDIRNSWENEWDFYIKSGIIGGPVRDQMLDLKIAIWNEVEARYDREYFDSGTISVV